MIDADIVRLDVEALVSNTDMYGGMWTEVADAVRRATGDEVARLAQRNIPRKTGEAWVTEAGALQGRQIIHVASMKRHGETNLEIVADSLRAALTKATECGAASVGVPAFGTGPKALHIGPWLQTFAEVAVRYLHGLGVDESAKSQGSKLAIVLVLYEPEDFVTQRRVLNRAVWAAWHRAGQPSDGLRELALPWHQRALIWSRWRVFGWVRPKSTGRA